PVLVTEAKRAGALGDGARDAALRERRLVRGDDDLGALVLARTGDRVPTVAPTGAVLLSLGAATCAVAPIAGAVAIEARSSARARSDRRVGGRLGGIDREEVGGCASGAFERVEQIGQRSVRSRVVRLRERAAMRAVSAVRGGRGPKHAHRLRR